MKRQNYVFYNMLANNQDEIKTSNLQNNNPPENSQYQDKQKNIGDLFYSISANNRYKISNQNLYNNNPSQSMSLKKLIPLLEYKTVSSGNAMRPYYSITPY